ncbi:MAG: hypothetical protein DMG97_01760 [Acidobacteria bacterium]|nr:MAG: hypothetical protein DMG96_42815 [Acidobacteriota bacterium]PYV77442.1 MAG: hypothetical protein DMG97_01760 [Acidobacteriota bacterium]
MPAFGANHGCLSASALAETAGTPTKIRIPQEHHSHLAKAAFWRHHKEANNSAKPAQRPQASSPKTQGKAAPAQVKPVSAKVTTGKNDQKPAPYASSLTKSSPKKAPVASKTKPSEKVRTPQTVLLKQ